MADDLVPPIPISEHEHLIFKALLAIEEVRSRCHDAPQPASLGLAFALAFLFAHSTGPRRHYDDFWRAVQDPGRPSAEEWAKRYIRERDADSNLAGILRGLGIAPSVQAIQRLRDLGKQRHGSGGSIFWGVVARQEQAGLPRHPQRRRGDLVDESALPADAPPMCNRARNKAEPESLTERFGVKWWADRPMDNRFAPAELRPLGRAWILREEAGQLGADVMTWDVLGGQANWPMTNVRNLALPQWQRLADDPARRCLVPLTEFCEWTPDLHDLGDGKKPLKGEMWFACTDQPVFAVAGFWQQTAKGAGFTMVTCDPNALVAPIHPKAMITILAEDDWSRWLRGDLGEVQRLQCPYPADRMTVRGPVFPTRRSPQ